MTDYIDHLTAMRMNPNPISGEKSPHKPAMLLAVLDLISSGEVSENRIEYGPELLEHFRRYFDIVKNEGDSCTPINPFWHMKTSTFWNHIIRPGKEDAYKYMDRPRGPNAMGEVIEGVKLDDGLFEMMRGAKSRAEIRETIITRYFPKHYARLHTLAQEEEQVGLYTKAIDDIVNGKAAEVPEVDYSARDLAFARIVKRAYHYQCAACGLRILYDGISLVDAAHIIPFSESHDDDPRNGLSLCKNHHWAMDQELIFPCSDHLWHVRKDIDDRIDAHRDLIKLNGITILPPEQKQYAPKRDALLWRENRLKAG